MEHRGKGRQCMKQHTRYRARSQHPLQKQPKQSVARQKQLTQSVAGHLTEHLQEAESTGASSTCSSTYKWQNGACRRLSLQRFSPIAALNHAHALATQTHALCVATQTCALYVAMQTCTLSLGVHHPLHHSPLVALPANAGLQTPPSASSIPYALEERP